MALKICRFSNTTKDIRKLQVINHKKWSSTDDGLEIERLRILGNYKSLIIKNGRQQMMD